MSNLARWHKSRHGACHRAGQWFESGDFFKRSTQVFVTCILTQWKAPLTYWKWCFWNWNSCVEISGYFVNLFCWLFVSFYFVVQDDMNLTENLREPIRSRDMETKVDMLCNFKRRQLVSQVRIQYMKYLDDCWII